MAEYVKFHDVELLIHEERGVPYVAVRDVVEYVGHDWDYYREKKLHDHVVEDMNVIQLKVPCDPSKSGGSHSKARKTQSMLMIPFSYVNGFTATIEFNKRTPIDRVERIRKIRRECFEVLSDYWSGGFAVKADPGQSETYNEAKRLMCRAAREPNMETILGSAFVLRLSRSPCYQAMTLMADIFQIGVYIPKDEEWLADRIDHYLKSRMSFERIITEICKE